MNSRVQSSPSLYSQVMGSAFGSLPGLVQTFHLLRGRHELDGEVEIDAPASAIARILARCLGAPLLKRSGRLRFELVATPDTETWTRHFPGRTMTSKLSSIHGQLVEQLGLARIGFDLKAHSDRLEMKLAWLRFLGVPCPRWLLPVIVAEESALGNQLHFLVEASVPFVGLVTRYKGYVIVPSTLHTGEQS